jgi:membrane protein implicated in regulation of membrane protease activity
MGMIDNPSADRFDPPPGAERFEPPPPERKGAWIVAALGIAVFLAGESFSWLHLSGAGALAAFVAFIVLVVLHFSARRAFQPDEHEPYSTQQRITR